MVDGQDHGGPLFDLFPLSNVKFQCQFLGFVVTVDLNNPVFVRIGLIKSERQGIHKGVKRFLFGTGLTVQEFFGETPVGGMAWSSNT